MFHTVIIGTLNKEVGENIQVIPYSIFCIKHIILCVACAHVQDILNSRYVKFILDASVYIIREVTHIL